LQQKLTALLTVVAHPLILAPGAAEDPDKRRSCLCTGKNSSHFQEGRKDMSRHRVMGKISVGVLILLLANPIFSQLIDIGKFKGVQVSYRLKFENTVMEKGTYDLEALKNPNTPSCYLRFKKGSRILCLVEGERLDYEVKGMARMTDPSIPQKPRLKMKRNPEEKVVYFMVETGRDSLFPYLWLRFKMDYEE
jgi:hypothetical protein